MAFAIARDKVTDEMALQIRKMLCFQPEEARSRYNGAGGKEPILFYFLENGILHLPYLYAAALYQIIPNIDRPFPQPQWQFSGSLRDRQIPVEAEAWQQLEERGTSILGLYPGFGKTIMGAKLASRVGLITCVLVHREILTGQWRHTFEKVTNARTWIVGEPNPPSTCDVIICMDTRWNKIPPATRDAVGFLIVDEAHAFCTPSHVSCLLSFHPKYILAETATLLREDGMHAMIYAMCGTHGVFRETDIPFKVVKVNTRTKPERVMNRQGGVNWTELVKNTLFDQRRNDIILDLVTSRPDSTILILTSLVDHVNLLYHRLRELGVSCDYMAGNRKNYSDCRVLVGTLSKIGTGFDQETACPDFSGRRFDTLILACSIKKYQMLVQNVGRAFRSEYPTILHLVDDDNIYKNHWYLCRKWYLLHNGEVEDITIRNTERPESTTENPQAMKQLQQVQHQQYASRLRIINNNHDKAYAVQNQLNKLRILRQ